MKYPALLLLPLLLLAGCGGHTGARKEAQFKVVASFLPLERLATELLHDLPGVEVSAIAPATSGCPHHYTLTPGDIRKVSDADVVVRLGNGIDAFVKPAEVQRYNPEGHLLTLAPIHGEEEAENHHHHDDHTEEDGSHNHNHDAEGIAHLWVSPLHMAEFTRLLSDSLATLYPIAGDTIRARGRELGTRLYDLHQRYKALVDSASNRNIASMHTSFNVLAHDIGLEVVEVVQVDVSAAPGPRTLERVLDELKSGQVAALLSEPQVSQALVETIANESGKPVFELDSGVTGSPEYPSLLPLFEANLRTLRQALLGE